MCVSSLLIWQKQPIQPVPMETIFVILNATFTPPCSIYLRLHILQAIHFDHLPNIIKTLRKEKGRKMKGCLAWLTTSPMTLGFTVSAHSETRSSSCTPSSSRRSRRRRDRRRKSPIQQPSVQLGPARLSGPAKCKSVWPNRWGSSKEPCRISAPITPLPRASSRVQSTNSMR